MYKYRHPKTVGTQASQAADHGVLALLARHTEVTQTACMPRSSGPSGGLPVNPIATPLATYLLELRNTLLGPQAPVALKRLVLFWFAHHRQPSHCHTSVSPSQLRTWQRVAGWPAGRASSTIPRFPPSVLVTQRESPGEPGVSGFLDPRLQVLRGMMLGRKPASEPT